MGTILVVANTRPQLLVLARLPEVAALVGLIQEVCCLLLIGPTIH